MARFSMSRLLFDAERDERRRECGLLRPRVDSGISHTVSGCPALYYLMFSDAASAFSLAHVWRESRKLSDRRTPGLYRPSGL